MILAEARPAYQYPVRPAKRQMRKPAPRRVAAVKRRSAVTAKTRYILVWLVAVALALGLASRFALAAKLTVDIAALNKQLAEAQAENEQLQLQIAELKSLARIEQIASTRLGMVRPAETRPIVANGGTAAPATVALAGTGDNRTAGAGGWIASVQRWLTRLIRAGLAEAKGL